MLKEFNPDSPTALQYNTWKISPSTDWVVDASLSIGIHPFRGYDKFRILQCSIRLQLFPLLKQRTRIDQIFVNRQYGKYEILKLFQIDFITPNEVNLLQKEYVHVSLRSKLLLF